MDRTSRVLEIIDAYRTRGHLMADTDPLNYRQRRHPDLDIITHGLTLWDLDREFPVGGFNGEQFMKLRDVLGVLRDAYCRTVGVEYMHILDPAQRRWIQDRVEVRRDKATVDEQTYILGRLNSAEAFEILPADQIHRAETVLPGRRRDRHPACWTPRWPRPPNTAPTRPSSGWPTAAGSTCWPTSSASPTR